MLYCTFRYVRDDDDNDVLVLNVGLLRFQVAGRTTIKERSSINLNRPRW